jgi:hypothetical protein
MLIPSKYHPSQLSQINSDVSAMFDHRGSCAGQGTLLG